MAEAAGVVRTEAFKRQLRTSRPVACVFTTGDAQMAPTLLRRPA